MATAIILLSHGSRHPQADDSVRQLARAVRRRHGRSAYAAHLDFSPATLPVVATLAAAEGYDRAIVVPLLFTTAFHMREDVPEAVRDARVASGIQVELAAQVGLGDDLVEVMAAMVPEVQRLALYSVGSSVPGANAAVAEFAQRLAVRIGAREAAAFVATGPDSCDGAGVTALVRWLDRDVHGAAVAPLFVSPGKLLDKLDRALDGAQHTVTVLPPLGTRLTDLVHERAAITG